MAPSYHSPAEWGQQLNLIAKLYVADGLSYDEIASRLYDDVRFITSYVVPLPCYVR